MVRPLTASIAAVAAAISFTAATGAAPAIQFKSVSVDLPFGDRSFEGSDADAINNNCLACHSVGMVASQPRLPRETWEAIVQKMRSRYKAPVADDDVKPIVDYLARIKGAD